MAFKTPFLVFLIHVEQIFYLGPIDNGSEPWRHLASDYHAARRKIVFPRTVSLINPS
jgi:hypothetical protein